MIFAVVIPIFLLLFLGYLTVKINLLNKVQIDSVGAFVIKVALPALLLHALASKDLKEIWLPSYFFVYAGMTFLLFCLTFWVAKKVFKNTNQAHTAIFSMGACMSNTGLIGTAVLSLLMGHQATTYISLVVIIESVLLIPAVLILAEMGLQKQSDLWSVIKSTARTLLTNPLFIAVILGIGCATLKIPLPKYLDQVLGMLGQAASPLALFAIGGSLAGLGIRSINVQSIWLVFSNNMLMPLGVYLGLSAVGVSQEMLYAGTLIAAMPMPTLFGILGQGYGLREEVLTPLMLSTVVGFMVVSSLIALWW